MTVEVEERDEEVADVRRHEPIEQSTEMLTIRGLAVDISTELLTERRLLLSWSLISERLKKPYGRGGSRHSTLEEFKKRIEEQDRMLDGGSKLRTSIVWLLWLLSSSSLRRTGVS
jgi:hypothetical protein